jgi:thiamine-monophosphate kinase
MPEKDTPGSEAEIVALFERIFRPDLIPSDLLIGIGDDAAAIEPGVDPDTKIVITADMLVEDVHFRRDIHGMYDIGWRTAVANLSDIASMGAQPRWGVVTLAVPEGFPTRDFELLGAGLKDAMSEHEAYVIGGDLTRSKSGIAISMTLIGETTGRLITRDGAKLGDVIAVTGSLGGSAAGLALLDNPEAGIPEDVRLRVIETHLRPRPRVWAGQALAGNDGIHAVMDISDGLGIDLGRICDASGVGCRIFEECIPIKEDVIHAAQALLRDPLEFINGGEDFELLIAGTKAAVEYVARVLSDDPDQPSITIIGDILDPGLGRHLARIDGTVFDPTKSGWDHFRRK